jgi:hypothetical protein
MSVDCPAASLDNDFLDAAGAGIKDKLESGSL